MSKEIWKDIQGYEGLYQISNIGRVKSLERKSWNGCNFITIKERIRKINLDSKGYPCLQLHKEGTAKMVRLHVLLYSHFKEEIPEGYVVDHDNNIKTDFSLDNLKAISQRENVSKDRKGSSKYTGVHWHKNRKKWQSNIKLKNGYKYLGSFDDEYEAHVAYQEALKNLVQFIE